MGADTKIQWAHSTFNPWRGCTKVSSGCKNCYAETLSKRNPKVLGVWGDDGTRVVASDAYWRGPLLWDRLAKKAGERHRVFCASLADVFEDRPDLVEPREGLWDLIYRTSNLDWLLLTKRPENISRMLPPSWVNEMPAPNVWLGTTCEDQQRADERTPHLLSVPSAVRFLSVEPMLGPVDLSKHLARRCAPHVRLSFDGIPEARIGWVIVGGESGAQARPFDVAWARSIVSQCREAGVPCFVKQLGPFPHNGGDGAGWASDFFSGRGRHWRWDISDGPPPAGLHVYEQRDPKGGSPEEWPEDLRVREIPVVGKST